MKKVRLNSIFQRKKSKRGLISRRIFRSFPPCFLGGENIILYFPITCGMGDALTFSVSSQHKQRTYRTSVNIGAETLKVIYQYVFL